MLELGYDLGFRPGQEDVVNEILSCRDVISVRPTGSGKTLCFILPTVCLGWSTVVFSPLVALMRDQVKKLHGMGVEAAEMSSVKSAAENDQAAARWARGELRFLYAAPERLENPAFREAMEQHRPDMVVIDECHCLSKWSMTFRPQYRHLGDFVREKDPRVVAAFTATLPDEAEADVRHVLGIGNARKIVSYERRSNLLLSSVPWTGGADFARYVIHETRGQTIVYFATVKRLVEASLEFQALLPPGEDMAVYHGQLSPSAKRANMDLFMRAEKPARIVLATNAFGMGIDKENVRHIVHRDIPGSVEALAQEIGRAGRDGKESRCRLFFDPSSVETQKFFVECGTPVFETVSAVHSALVRMSDANGRLVATQNEIAAEAGLAQRFISSILSVLKSERVIERDQDRDDTAGVEWLAVPERPSKAYLETREAVETLGYPDGRYLTFSMGDLAARLGVEKKTLASRFRSYDASGAAKYMPPLRTTPIRLVGSLANIDFDALAERRALEQHKLDVVLRYPETPDGKKHEFLEHELNGA